MIITYHGKQALKMTLGELTLAYNPISKDSKLDIKPSKFGADVVMISHNHPDVNGVETVVYGDKEPFVIDGPGEYEHKDIFIRGVGVKSGDTMNTIYRLKLDGITIVLLGDLVEKTLPSEVYDAIGIADVVCASLGSGLSPAQVHTLANKLTPSIIIPLDYTKESLTTFLKEASSEGTKPEDKLTLKVRDLSGKEGEVFVLKS